MAEANTSTTKRCYGCKVEVALMNFNKNRSKPGGLASECRDCTKAAGKVTHKKYKEKHNESSRKYREENLEKVRASDREYAKRRDKKKNNERNAAARAADPDRNRAYQKKSWYKNHEKNLERKRVYRKKTPELQLVYVRSRQTRQKKAMPLWAGLDNIKAIYRQCAWVTMVTGIKHHVDHFYPLKSDVVCGLHNEFNLRIIPARDNLSKGNTFPTEDL